MTTLLEPGQGDESATTLVDAREELIDDMASLETGETATLFDSLGQRLDALLVGDHPGTRKEEQVEPYHVEEPGIE